MNSGVPDSKFHPCTFSLLWDELCSHSAQKEMLKSQSIVSIKVTLTANKGSSEDEIIRVDPNPV